MSQAIMPWDFHAVEEAQNCIWQWKNVGCLWDLS